MATCCKLRYAWSRCSTSDETYHRVSLVDTFSLKYVTKLFSKQIIVDANITCFAWSNFCLWSHCGERIQHIIRFRPAGIIAHIFAQAPHFNFWHKQTIIRLMITTCFGICYFRRLTTPFSLAGGLFLLLFAFTAFVCNVCSWNCSSFSQKTHSSTLPTARIDKFPAGYEWRIGFAGRVYTRNQFDHTLIDWRM